MNLGDATAKRLSELQAVNEEYAKRVNELEQEVVKLSHAATSATTAAPANATSVSTIPPKKRFRLCWCKVNIVV